ncbi:hypothetical protein QQZ08_005051 [Neonectria magnoliae]|uniref:CHAT domain-containing protein n=1 Tax=Neonectria magnoliae TaxID=2732573 RepID=A0ABR1I6E1_9HYPO
MDHLDTEESAVADALSRCTNLILIGHYDEALALLDVQEGRLDLALEDRVEIYRAAARVFVHRGFPLVAKEWLAKAIELYENEDHQQPSLPLRVHFEFVSVVGCGEQSEDESCSKEARQFLGTLTRLDEMDKDAVEMLASLDKMDLMKHMFCQQRGVDINPGIASRTRSLIDQAMAQGRYHDAWALTTPYIVSAASKEVLQWLRSVVNAEGVPPSIRGLFALDTAKQLVKSSSAQEDRGNDIERSLIQAEAFFKSSGNELGLTEVRLLRLKHGLQPSTNLLFDMIEQINQFFQASFPRGILQSAPLILTAAFQRSDLRTYVNLQEVFQGVCVGVGLKHEVLLLELQLLAAMNAGSGYLGRVLELGQDLYVQFRQRKQWSQVWMTGRVLSLAQSQMNNITDSELLATEIYELCQREDLQSVSEAAYHLAFIRSLKPRDDPTSGSLIAKEIVEMLRKNALDDLTADETELACDKMHLIATIQFDMAGATRPDAEHWAGTARTTLDELRRVSEKLSEETKIRIQGNAYESEVAHLLQEGSKGTGTELEDQAIEICGSLIDTYGAHDMLLQQAMKYQMRALCRTQLFQKERNTQSRIEYLLAAEKDARIAAEKLAHLGARQYVMNARHFQTRLYITAWNLYNIEDSVVLDTLAMFEATADAIRQELSALGSLSALLQKQKFAASKEVTDLYNWAIGVSAAKLLHQQLWRWSQKRKARSLSDLLGIGVLVPASIREEISADPGASTLFEKLTGLQTSLETALPGEKGFLRHRIEETEEEMREHDALRRFLALRDGTVSDVTQLKNLKIADESLETQRDVVFVDWIAHQDQIYVVTVRASNPEASCKAVSLPVGASYLREWKSENFDTNEKRKRCLERDNLRNPEKPMRRLDCLLSPLQNTTTEGDLLVLSTTSSLSMIPLHALRIFDPTTDRYMALIERNPVVYAPSLPVVEICLSRSHRSRTTDLHNGLFLSTLDVESEAARIYSQMDSLAHRLSGSSITDSAATKHVFVKSAPKARILHYHGHCVFEVDNPLKQSLVLAPPQGQRAMMDSALQTGTPIPGTEKIIEDVQRTSGNSIILSRSMPSLDPHQLSPVAHGVEEAVLLSADTADDAGTNLTVEEIFKVPLSSPLVVLIACDSASQAILAGDEPMGMVAGLLCAGAASVIGALWPIPSVVGREFSKEFYENLTSQRAKSRLVDIAVALQEATLALMDNPLTSETYCWGAFCLYGSWIYDRGSEN